MPITSSTCTDTSKPSWIRFQSHYAECLYISDLKKQNVGSEGLTRFSFKVVVMGRRAEARHPSRLSTFLPVFRSDLSCCCSKSVLVATSWRHCHEQPIERYNRHVKPTSNLRSRCWLDQLSPLSTGQILYIDHARRDKGDHHCGMNQSWEDPAHSHITHIYVAASLCTFQKSGGVRCFWHPQRLGDVGSQ